MSKPSIARCHVTNWSIPDGDGESPILPKLSDQTPEGDGIDPAQIVRVAWLSLGRGLSCLEHELHDNAGKRQNWLTEIIRGNGLYDGIRKPILQICLALLNVPISQAKHLAQCDGRS